MTVRTIEKEEEIKDEQEIKLTIRVRVVEAERKVEMRKWLCIPNAMQRRILYDAHNIPTERDFGAN
jgi:hypothetical protein